MILSPSNVEMCVLPMKLCNLSLDPQSEVKRRNRTEHTEISSCHVCVPPAQEWQLENEQCAVKM